MRDEPFNSEDPTEPIPPPSFPQQNKQGKMVIGSFNDAQKRHDRQPYQYPSPSPQQGNQQRDRAYSQNPQYPQYPQQQPGRRNQLPPNGSSNQPRNAGANANANANMQNYPVRQVPPPAGDNIPPEKLTPTRKSGFNWRRGRRIGCLGTLLILVILLIFASVIGQHVLAFGSAISTQSPLSTQTGYMGTSDRVSLLVLGYGGGNHQGANLTDSMVIMSLLPQNSHTTLVSVPRDLWVQIPAGSGSYQKINAAYEFGSNNGQKPASGGDAAAQKVSVVTGLDVKYWVTINFTGFRDLINSIGGIDVYVPDSFKSLYPKNDDPSIDPSWITISFKKGMQHMDGETAIRYARAREVLDNLAEGTDFARSARQQIIIKAVLSKVKQVSTWPSMFNAMDALQKTIYTNMSLADLMQFALKMDLNNAHRVGLSNQNVLQDSTANGQYILQPKNGNWQGIIDYVKQQLYN